jgi:hypothetical protein
MAAVVFTGTLLAGCSSVVTAPRGLSSHTAWEATNGGVLCGAPECEKADLALHRVSEGMDANLSIRVLTTDSMEAFSFRDGTVYVARGLVDRLNDDELAATVAHELGHLLHDGVIASPAALRGSLGGNGDIERTADLLGRGLLVEHHIAVDAMPSALEKVADASRNTPYYQPLEERIAYLRALNSSARD